MAKLNNTDGFILHGWMVNELGLRGGDLFAFALIHQFSQSEAGVYKGGVPYLAAWLGCVDNTARKYLQDLVEKGLIKADRGSINGIPFCYYRVCIDTPQNLQGTPQKLGGDPSKIEVPTPQKLRGENNNRKVKGKINNTLSGRVFVKPSIEEVRQYCQARGNGIDPEEFVAFYESKGWKVGNAPMKDWKAAVITWEKKRKQPHPQTPSPKSSSPVDYYATLIQEMHEFYGTGSSTPDEQ